jgi:hypothetical protein
MRKIRLFKFRAIVFLICLSFFTCNNVYVTNATVNYAQGKNVGVTLAKPINLKCNSKTHNSITLGWDKSTSTCEIEYDVFMGSRKIGTTNAQTEYLVKDLSPNTSYSFSIRARDKEGNTSEKSDVLVEETLAENIPTTDNNNDAIKSNPETIVVVQSPVDLTTVSGKIDIKGYVLSNNEEAMSTKVYIDGIEYYLGMFDKMIGIETSAFKNKFPEYKNSGNSGFEMSIDTYRITNGIHKVKLQFYNTFKEVTIVVNNKKGDIIINSPDLSKEYEGSIKIEGTLLSCYETVGWWDSELYIDGKKTTYVINLDYKNSNLSSGDPNYKNFGTRGFSCDIDIGALSTGIHIVKFRFNSIKKHLVLM